MYDPFFDDFLDVHKLSKLDEPLKHTTNLNCLCLNDTSHEDMSLALPWHSQEKENLPHGNETPLVSWPNDIRFTARIYG